MKPSIDHPKARPSARPAARLARAPRASTVEDAARFADSWDPEERAFALVARAFLYLDRRRRGLARADLTAALLALVEVENARPEVALHRAIAGTADPTRVELELAWRAAMRALGVREWDWDRLGQTFREALARKLAAAAAAGPRKPRNPRKPRDQSS